jgi:two-component system KDP operon response regulator KdpE
MNPKTILIVDDDSDLVLGLTVRLRAKGYRVLSAVDATSALEMHREKPDLLILDLGLPGGDGLRHQKVRRLRRRSYSAVEVPSATRNGR